MEVAGSNSSCIYIYIHSIIIAYGAVRRRMVRLACNRQFWGWTWSQHALTKGPAVTALGGHRSGLEGKKRKDPESSKLCHGRLRPEETGAELQDLLFSGLLYRNLIFKLP